MSKIKIYIEDSYYNQENDTQEFLIDFFEEEDLNNFESVLGFGKNDIASRASMVRIVYPKPCNSRRMRKGSWYNLPSELFSQGEYIPNDENGPGSNVIRSTLIHRGFESHPKDFLLSPVWAEINEVTFNHHFNCVNKLKLNIVDCGQGNWNEVISDNLVLIYDIGASRYLKKSEVRVLVSERFKVYGEKQVAIIISHWDIDHYQAILSCSKKELTQIRGVVTPSQVPKTLTYRRVIDLLDIEAVPLYCIPPSQRDRTDHSKKIILKQYIDLPPFSIFRAVSGSSRNQTGIVILVQGNEKLAILCGDHHYDKILDSIAGLYKYEEAVLVTPHHGGNAGILDTNAWKSEFNILHTPISVGRNSYSHPMSKYVKALTKLTGTSPCRTDTRGTISYDL